MTDVFEALAAGVAGFAGIMAAVAIGSAYFRSKSISRYWRRHEPKSHSYWNSYWKSYNETHISQERNEYKGQ